MNTNAAKAQYVAAHQKSTALALMLAIPLGPIGLLYASPKSAILMTLLSVVTAGVALIVTWPLSIIMAITSVSAHNQRVAATAELLGR
jgi:hypothetical protein